MALEQQGPRQRLPLVAPGPPPVPSDGSVARLGVVGSGLHPRAARHLSPRQMKGRGGAGGVIYDARMRGDGVGEQARERGGAAEADADADADTDASAAATAAATAAAAPRQSGRARGRARGCAC